MRSVQTVRFAKSMMLWTPLMSSGVSFMNHSPSGTNATPRPARSALTERDLA